MLKPGQTQSGGIPATRTSKIFLLQVAALATLLLMVTTRAEASYLDLQTAGATGTINGAFYTQGAILSGTGTFPAFVQVAGGGSPTVHSAYNTTANNVFDNGSSPTFNHAITVADLEIVSCPSGSCYRFFLDINESNTATDKYLSLDELRIFSGAVAANQNTTDVTAPTTLGTLRYDIDGAGDTGVLLDYSLSAGSGKADMVLLVPVWGGAATDQVYLFSSFGALGIGTGTGGTVLGGNYGNSDGFEEWALNAQTLTPVPEPSTFALYGLGAAMLFVGGLWQKRRKEAKS